MSVKLLTALVVALSTLVLEAKATSMDKVNLIGFNQCSCEYITHTVDELAFSPPNCSELIRQRNDGESNQTHIDFRIGLRTLSDYLVDVRVSFLSECIIVITLSGYTSLTNNFFILRIRCGKKKEK